LEAAEAIVAEVVGTQVVTVIAIPVDLAAKGEVMAGEVDAQVFGAGVAVVAFFVLVTAAVRAGGQEGAQAVLADINGAQVVAVVTFLVAVAAQGVGVRLP